ncbi:adenylate/guanylate cyclase domain-containing protein [bacterium]|nr:adenylate/guanylate cyclase domain-containing protein [bacterium]
MFKFSTPKIIIALLFLFVLAFIHLFSHNFIDNVASDLFTKAHAKITKRIASDKVVLVVIDNKSLKQISWPWKRNLYSELLNFLEFEAGAKVVAFQNLIIYPDTYFPEEDAEFYSDLLKHNILINSFLLSGSDISGDILPHEYLDIFLKKTNVKIIDNRIQKTDISYKNVIKLPKDLLLNSKYFASSFIQEDKDEIVRNYVPFININGRFLPSLALSAYSMYTGIDTFVLYDDKFCSNDGCKTLNIPIIEKPSKDYIGNITNTFLAYIKWYTPKQTYYSHKAYSAIDVLDSYYALKNGNLPKINPEEFKDKIVIVGLNTDTSVWDFLSETPILTKQADVDVHAVVIDNMLQNKFMSVESRTISHIITAIFMVLILLGFKNFRTSLIFAFLLSCLYLIFFLCEFFSNVYVEPLSPIITLFACVFLKRLYSIITTDKTTEMIKRAMGKYISKDVMKKVLLDLDKLKLGGIRTVVTVLFVDIRNFTTISEQLSPSEVTSILNEYFSVIEPIIAKHHGVINKYLGDGALAIFGEPIKTERHPLNAVLCANEILHAVQSLKNKLVNEGKHRIEVGVGINTGEVFAGNIGTEERLEYTIIGDNVNLAYRIESYNRILKTQFLISENTYELVKDNVDVVKLSQVNIKGKSLPIDIYEVLKVKE